MSYSTWESSPVDIFKALSTESMRPNQWNNEWVTTEQDMSIIANAKAQDLTFLATKKSLKWCSALSI